MLALQCYYNLICCSSTYFFEYLLHCFTGSKLVITSILVSFVLWLQKFVLQIWFEGTCVRLFIRSEKDLFDGRMLDQGVRERRWTQAFASSYVCSVTG